MAKSKLQFDTIEIREFPIILSNNPSCKYGPSIELGWEYDANSSDGTIIVSHYEKLREGKRRKEKAGCQSILYLSQVQREAMLRDAGYSDKEVLNAMKTKAKARRQRSLSKHDSVPFMLRATFKASMREKKVGRAVRNMRRLQQKQQQQKVVHGAFLQFTKVGGCLSQLITFDSVKNVLFTTCIF